jgi:uncharacterized protein YbjT (DUF2867 family)
VAVIAVIGGTGFVGTRTARALVEAGHEVRVVSRGKRRRPVRVKGTTTMRANVVTGDGLDEALRGCDAVIHLTAIISERGAQTFDAVIRGGTENVMAAARRAGAGHLILLSAIGASANPRHPYLKAKWAAEQAVKGGGIPHTIIRSSLIFGPGDGFFTRLTRLMRRSMVVVPVAGNGQARFQPIAVGDVVRVLLLALERGPDNSVHEIGGPDQLTYDQLIRTLGSELHMSRAIVHLPVMAILPPALLMSRLLKNPPVTPDQLRMLELDNVTRPDSVSRTWGFQPIPLAGNCAYLENY